MIHPTAIIEEGASIGENVTIGPFSTISGEAIIGDGCILSQGVRIEGKTTLGRNNKVSAYAVLGAIPQSMGYKESDDVSLIIGDDNEIKEYVLISSGSMAEEGVTRIGNANYIMAYVHVGHDCVIGNHNIMANATSLGGHVRVGDRNVFGAMTAVHQFVHLGSYCMFGGASAITQDIPPFMLAEGNRANVRGLNLIGIKRNLGRDAVKEIKASYKALFRSGQPIKESATSLLESEKLDQNSKQLCEFILASKRGIPFEHKIVED